jgi:hypothetical protein
MVHGSLRILAGDFLVAGRASSSIVPRRGRVASWDKARFRRVMACRWRTFLFCVHLLGHGRYECCLVVLEAAKVKVRGLRHTDGMSHGRSRRVLGSASGIVRTRNRALATEDSH